VEVKTRSENALVTGAESIDVKKAQRTRNAAEFFMKKLNTDLPPRIDVANLIVSKNEDGKESWKLNYIKSAI
ncbi:MAG: YraN family protein, partial [Clostridia bacterium]|nr:YraN family protein [Clostridia bacterium]